MIKFSSASVFCHQHVKVKLRLSRLDVPDRFSTIFGKGDNFCDFPVCFPAHYIHSGKDSTLKGKNLLWRGAKSFLLY